jgi:acid stress-induced BolA-like protein IbaG/YrbA
MSLNPITWLDIADVSDGHVAAGYTDSRATNPEGRELAAIVVASAFDGIPPLGRHQMIHGVMQDELDAGTIHSIQMRCWTPNQWEMKGSPQTLSSAPCTPNTSPSMALKPLPPPSLLDDLQPSLPESMTKCHGGPGPTSTPEKASKKACRRDIALCDGSCSSLEGFF